MVSQRTRDAEKLFRLIRDYDHFARAHNTLELRTHQLRNMRNLTFDVLLIRAKNARQLHVAVVNQHAQTLAEQSLDNRNDRTLAQVVSPLLKAQSEFADVLATRRQYHIYRPFDLTLVAAGSNSAPESDRKSTRLNS